MLVPEGVIVAMLTPFDESGRIDEAEVRRIVNFLIEERVNGIFPVASVGEFVHMDLGERKYLIDIVVDEANGRVDVIPGTGATCHAKSIELALYAKEKKCSAIVLSGPYFFKNSEEAVEGHLKKVAESVDIPIFLYNIPFFANEVTPQIAQKLASIPNVIGIKDSSGSMVNLMNLLDMTHKVNPNFKVLVGAEEMFYPALLMGAEGCMTAMSGIMPEFMVGIYKAFKDGNYQLAHNLQFAILHIIREMKSVNFPQGFKEAMSVRGFKMGAPRMSYPPQTLAKFKSLRDDLGASMGNLLSKYFPGAPLRYEKEVSFMQKFSYPQRQIQVAESGLKKHDSCTVCGMCEGNTYRNAINKPISELAKQTSVDNGVQTILDENLREIIASVTKRILGEK